MTWDMMLVTVALVTVLLSIILLMLVSRIWEDRTPPKSESESTDAQEVTSRSAEIDKVNRQENLLA
jgi:hypothetical protein